MSLARAELLARGGQYAALCRAQTGAGEALPLPGAPAAAENQDHQGVAGRFRPLGRPAPRESVVVFGRNSQSVYDLVIDAN